MSDGVVEVESYSEGFDYLMLVGGEGGGELQCHALISGVVAELKHCKVKGLSFRITQVEILVNIIFQWGMYLLAM